MAETFNTVTPTTRRSWQDWRYFVLLAAGLALLFALTTPKLSQTIYTVPDAQITTEGDWRDIELARYDRGGAVFGRAVGTAFDANLGAERPVETVELRLYSYGGAENVVRIGAGEQSELLTYGEAKGVARYAVTFSPPVTANTIRADVVTLGQASFLVDSVTVTSPGTHLSRALARAALGITLALALWLACALTIAPTTSSGRIYTSIDGLRGIGVLLVLALHATGYAGLPDLSGQPFVERLAKHGHFGVEVFYVVSAYTLTFSLFSAVRRQQSDLIGNFWARRINRILPTMMVIILIAWLCRDLLSSGWPEGEKATLGVLWRYANMTYIFDRDVLRAAFGHSVLWSISTEFQFYLLMPILMLPLVRYLSGTAKREHLYFHAGLLAVGSVLATAWSRDLLAEQSWMPYTLFYHFDAFMIGIAVALVVMAQRMPRTKADEAEGPDRAVLSPLPTPAGPATPNLMSRVWPEALGLGSLVALVLLVALATPFGEGLDAIGATKAMRPERLFVLLACAGAIYAAERAERAGATLGAFTALRTIGLLSFIIYLVHVPALQIVGTMPLPGLFGTEADRYVATLTLGLALTLVLSLVIHRTVEHPSVRLNVLAMNRPAYRIASSCFVLLIAASLLSYIGRG